MEPSRVIIIFFKITRQEEGPDVMRAIIDRFGRFGYAAVDSRNQIDMSGAEQVMEFGRLAEAGEAAAITMIVVSYTIFGCCRPIFLKYK